VGDSSVNPEAVDHPRSFARLTVLKTGEPLRIEYQPGDTVGDLLSKLERTGKLVVPHSWLPVLVGSAGGLAWGIQLHRTDKLPVHSETLEEYCTEQLGVDCPAATAYIHPELSAEQAWKRGWRKGGISLYAGGPDPVGAIEPCPPASRKGRPPLDDDGENPTPHCPPDWPEEDLEILIVSNIAGG
jgi:hypothetical protein